LYLPVGSLFRNSSPRLLTSIATLTKLGSVQVANRRLRVQGTVEQDSLKSGAGSTTFVLMFNNQTIDVRYNGDPGGIFQECIPVVAHGRLVGDIFEANRIEVKHSNTYSEANPDRLAQSKAEQCSLIAG
jgi:cytochrome c-type biogenesis protein CcmE